MAFEQKNNNGALFKNDRKDKETQPDYTGSIRLNGADFQLAAWLKTAKSGKKFMSVSVGKQIIRGAGPSVNSVDSIDDDRPIF